jgi:transposase
MGEVTTVGLDIAKSVFQVHGIDAEGAVLIQRKLPRSRLLPFFEKLPACLVGIEACATATTGRGSSRRWATRCG